MREQPWITPASRLSRDRDQILADVRTDSQEKNTNMSYASDNSDCGFEASVPSSTAEPASIKAGSDDSQDKVDDSVASAESDTVSTTVSLDREHQTLNLVTLYLQLGSNLHRHRCPHPGN